ncbi:MAG: aspartate aminotransferase family protein [Nitrososphaerota archaeon]|nr:aspartate aminotransferase family protein [Nitrososphaerota archaeon]MDG7024530.1 aspartate aminotransferase family protein [Nitrososphaerota archaeon]
MQAALLDEPSVKSRFQKKTKKSAELFRRAAEVSPGGVMAGIKFFEPYPLFMKRARGSHIWDVDGNEYVDYLMSYGAIVLGHGDQVQRRAIGRVLESFGTSVTGTPTEEEVEYGTMLRDLYHPGGLIRFTNSGLEATLLAVRMARASTGRKKVAKFEGHYHGAVDRLLFSYAPPAGASGASASPVPIGDSAEVDGDMLRESLVLPFNDWDSTERILNGHSKELACVIMEPFEEGVIPAERRFMTNLRKLTKDLKVPLIYDEVKTGFRVRLGGAGEFYSTTPDLTCLGKIIGGGHPIGAVVGDSELMELLDPRGEKRSRVFHSGTFNGNPLSLSVGRATVEELSRRGMFETLCRRTGDLKRALSRELARRQVPHLLLGEGGMFNLYLTRGEVKNYREAKSTDLRTRRLLDLELIIHGVYLKPENRFCLSLAHTEDDVRSTRDALAQSLDSSRAA